MAADWLPTAIGILAALVVFFVRGAFLVLQAIFWLEPAAAVGQIVGVLFGLALVYFAVSRVAGAIQIRVEGKRRPAE
jgi:hypothetical protein